MCVCVCVCVGGISSVLASCSARWAEVVKPVNIYCSSLSLSLSLSLCTWLTPFPPTPRFPSSPHTHTHTTHTHTRTHTYLTLKQNNLSSMYIFVSFLLLLPADTWPSDIHLSDVRGFIRKWPESLGFGLFVVQKKPFDDVTVGSCKLCFIDQMVDNEHDQQINQ